MNTQYKWYSGHVYWRRNFHSMIQSISGSFVYWHFTGCGSKIINVPTFFLYYYWNVVLSHYWFAYFLNIRNYCAAYGTSKVSSVWRLTLPLYIFIYIRRILCFFVTTWKWLHCDREMTLFFRLLRNVHAFRPWIKFLLDFQSAFSTN